MYPFELINEVLMKRVWVAMLACAALAAWGQATPLPPCKPGQTNMAEARKRLPILASLDDESFIKLAHEKYYSELPIEKFASYLCVEWPIPDKRQKLGVIDRWRYESCQTDAAKAPTSQGVFQGMRVCREKFGQ
jgi:hypothetical protein